MKFGIYNKKEYNNNISNLLEIYYQHMPVLVIYLSQIRYISILCGTFNTYYILTNSQWVKNEK